MCGILGYIGAVDTDYFTKALHLLEHRGPDGYGVWTSEDKQVTLGHRRLSILDLSDSGTQPIRFGKYVITFNGEIYNFVELRKQLEQKGYSFSTETDTEVLIASFAEWGQDALQRMNGMWAFGIWDTEEQTLTIARDRFGKKPLFYSNDKPGQFIFASEMKGIMPFLGEVSVSPDFFKLIENTFAYESTENCLIKGIKRFPAGSVGVLKDGKLSIRKYWDTFESAKTTEVPKTYEEQVEKYRELFFNACELRMRSDVAIGAAVSGGLDSSSVITVLNEIDTHKHSERVSEDWKHVFVATFRGTQMDETEYAQSIVDHIGVKATFLDIDPAKSIDRFDRYLYLFEEVFITSPVGMADIYREMKAHDISVSIDGHGADEMLSGYANTIEKALFDCGFNPKHIKEILTANIPDPELRDKGWIARFTRFLRENWRMWTRSKVAKVHLFRRFLSSLPQDDYGYMNMHLLKLFEQTSMPTLLRNYDRYSMSNSVEIRMPFMDHRLVSYSFALPWRSKVRDGFSKSILRDAVGPYLPDKVRYRRSKIGFSSPNSEWIRGPWKEYFQDKLHSTEFENSDLIRDKKQVRKIFEDLYNLDKLTGLEGFGAYHAIAPFLWEQAFLKQNWKLQ